jgi:hypothetical protein
VDFLKEAQQGLEMHGVADMRQLHDVDTLLKLVLLEWEYLSLPDWASCGSAQKPASDWSRTQEFRTKAVTRMETTKQPHKQYAAAEVCPCTSRGQYKPTTPVTHPSINHAL